MPHPVPVIPGKEMQSGHLIPTNQTLNPFLEVVLVRHMVKLQERHIKKALTPKIKEDMQN